MQDTVYNETTIVDTSNSGVAWPAIFAGAIATIALTLLLFPLGSALGLSSAHVDPSGPSNGVETALTVTAVIWLIIVQWVSAGFGGYLTGRLRTKWVGAHTHEVFFRDTAHGFLSWGVATLFLTVIVVAIAAPILGGGASGAAHGMAMRGAAMHQGSADYDVDSLLRPSSPSANTSDEAVRGDTARILARGDVSDTDRVYLGQVVATRAGLSQDEAQKRVDNTIAQRKAKMEEARKDASKASLFLFLSMLIGAFIATTAGALGGRHRDVHYRYGRLVE